MRIANVVLKMTLAAVGLTLAGTSMLIFDVVVGRTAGVVAACAALVVVIIGWIALPIAVSTRHPRAEP